MWALGVLTYMLLTASHPFDDEGQASDDQIRHNILHRQASFADWTASASARQFVEMLLRKDPTTRLSIEQLLQDASPAAPSPSPTLPRPPIPLLCLSCTRLHPENPSSLSAAPVDRWNGRRRSEPEHHRRCHVGRAHDVGPGASAAAGRPCGCPHDPDCCPRWWDACRCTNCNATKRCALSERTPRGYAPHASQCCCSSKRPSGPSGQTMRARGPMCAAGCRLRRARGRCGGTNRCAGRCSRGSYSRRRSASLTPTVRGPPLATATRLAARADASCPAGKGYISTADLDRVLRRFGQSSGSEQLLQGVTEGDREGQRITYGSFVRMMTHTVKQAGRPNTLPPSRRHSPTSAKPPPPPPCCAVSTRRRLTVATTSTSPATPCATSTRCLLARWRWCSHGRTAARTFSRGWAQAISPYLPPSPHISPHLPTFSRGWAQAGALAPPHPSPCRAHSHGRQQASISARIACSRGGPPARRPSAAGRRWRCSRLRTHRRSGWHLLSTLHVIAAGAQALQGGLRGRLWRAPCRGRARSEAPEVDRFHPDGEQAREGSPPLPPL